MTFYPLEKLHCLEEGYRKAFKVAGRHILLLVSDGERFLIENRCPHAGHPLLESTIRDGKIRCPLHGIEFGLKSGRSVNVAELSASQCLVYFRLAYRDNLVGVEL